MAKKPKFKITPIGGLGEIGKNMTLFECNGEGFLLDCGIMFPANDMHGVDYIIPDFRWLEERADIRLHAWLLRMATKIISARYSMSSKPSRAFPCTRRR